MAHPTDVDDWAAVDSLADFVAYLRLLSGDFDRDQAQVAEQERQGWRFVEGEWRHPQAGDYLEAWAAWLDDCYLADGHRGERSEVEPPSWSRFAFQLWAARMCE